MARAARWWARHLDATVERPPTGAVAITTPSGVADGRSATRRARGETTETPSGAAQFGQERDEIDPAIAVAMKTPDRTTWATAR
jgi:hypothetical protein